MANRLPKVRRANEKSAAWDRQGEIVRMYVDEGLTLQEIGAEVGFSRQTIWNILQDAGIRAAQKGRKPPARRKTELDAEIRRLYVEEDKPIQEIARILHLWPAPVSESLRLQGVKIKRGGQRRIVFPKLRELKIGDSLDLPQVGGTKRNKYSRYYIMAKKAGIKISVRVIEDDKVKVTRVA